MLVFVLLVLVPGFAILRIENEPTNCHCHLPLSKCGDYNKGVCEGFLSGPDCVCIAGQFYKTTAKRKN
jgi:hypothetical protein